METKPIPVRLSADMIERIDSAAKMLGMDDRTAVIRFCLKSFLQHYEKEGFGKLKPDWEKILEGFDGRASEVRFVAEQSGKYKTKKEGGK